MNFRSRKVRIILGAGILLGILGVTFAFTYAYFKPHKKVSGKTADYQTTVTEMLNTYLENEVEADSIFLNKIIEVKGKVREINPTDTGEITLILGGETEMGGVSASLLVEQAEVAKNLKVGDEVTVKGFCSGYLLDVVLVKCIIVK